MPQTIRVPPAPTKTPSTSARKPPLPALSGLRTVLAINVMFFHFTPPHPNFLTTVISNAYVFVGFFFLISGFVLAYNYGDLPTLSKRAFYVARFARVYPVYLLVLLLSVPFLKLEYEAQTHSDFWRGVVLTPLTLQGWSPSLATFWNTVGWTVPAELTLYALFPLLLRVFAANDRRLATSGRVVLAILGLWIVGIIPHLLYFFLNPDHLPGAATRFTYGFWLRALKYTPIAYVCTFSAGILLARLNKLLGPATALRRGLMALGALVGLAWFFASAVDRIPYVLVHGSLLLPLFCLLLLGLSTPSPVAAIFSWRPLVLFGETTFALYLLHFNAFILIHVYRLPERLHVSEFDPWISFVAIVLLAAAIRRFYERPAREFLLRILSPAKS